MSTKATRKYQQLRKEGRFITANAAAAKLETKFRLQGSFEKPIHQPGAQRGSENQTKADAPLTPELAKL